jgi:hypothetical protein
MRKGGVMESVTAAKKFYKIINIKDKEYELVLKIKEDDKKVMDLRLTQAYR